MPLADGSFYVLGTRSTQAPFVSILQKRQSTGAPDWGFGDGDGEVTIDAPTSFGPVSMHAAYLLADGRLLMYGYIEGTNANELLDVPDDRVVFARLLANGSPDPSFSGDGFMWHPAYQGTGESFSTLRMVPATAPIGAFGFEVTEGARTSLQVFDASGRLDTAFGEDGAIHVDLEADARMAHGRTGDVGGSVSGWAAAPGGGWMLASRTSWSEACPKPPDDGVDDGFSGPTFVKPCTNPSLQERRLYRYTAAGTPDAPFGVEGRVALVDPTRTDRLFGGEDGEGGGILVQQDDGKLLVIEAAGGYATAFRWTVDGAADPSWSGDGLATLRDRSAYGTAMYLASASIDARGRLIVTYSSGAFGDDETYLARLTADGRRDATFDRMNSWMPVLRGRDRTAAWVSVVPDELGRLLWWSDLGNLQCCPWSGGNDSIIGALTNGDVAAPEPTLRIRFAGATCGGRSALACPVRRARSMTVIGTLSPVPPPGRRDVYLSLAESCQFTDTVALRVDDRGRFRHRVTFARGSAQVVVARREAWGAYADAASRPLWVGTSRCR